MLRLSRAPGMKSCMYLEWQSILHQIQNFEMHARWLLVLGSGVLRFFEQARKLSVRELRFFKNMHVGFMVLGT